MYPIGLHVNILGTIFCENKGIQVSNVATYLTQRFILIYFNTEERMCCLACLCVQ